MKIKVIKTGFLEENCYILEKNNKCIIIDPGDEFEKIKNEISNEVLAVLITHRHFDHIGALDELINEYKVPVYEKMNLEETNYKIDDFEFNAIFFPGHTTDSVAYYFYKENVMFTGDFLFYHTVGRCDLEGGSFEQMQDSIEKIKKNKKDIVLYPGHGEKTTLEEEKKNNPYF